MLAFKKSSKTFLKVTVWSPGRQKKVNTSLGPHLAAFESASKIRTKDSFSNKFPGGFNNHPSDHFFFFFSSNSSVPPQKASKRAGKRISQDTEVILDNTLL